ncbi:MAG: L-lactate permease [Lacipirellulaceae bacterium]
MSDAALAILATLPIVAVAVLLVGMRWPAYRAMPLCYAIVVVLALVAWQTPSVVVVAASLKGLVITVELMFIVFGAILLLNALEASGALARINHAFHTVNPDKRVQAILVAWLFGSFIEGAAGFGTPAAVAVPLMVGLGFPAMAAVTAGMIIQSTPVSFGACGTPIMVGLHDGLRGAGSIDEFAIAQGFLNGEALLNAVALKVAVLHATCGLLVPLLLVATLTKFFGPNRSARDGLAIWPFALFASIAMTGPYLCVAWLLGPEFPTIVGGLIGLAVVTPAAQARWFLPKGEPPWDFGDRRTWLDEWTGLVAPPKDDYPRGMSLASAWSPYVIVAVMLVLSRLPQLPVKDWLRGVSLRWDNILGTGMSESIEPLYLPGSFFVLVSLLVVAMHRVPPRKALAALSRSARLMVGASFALVFTVPMVQVFLNSGGGSQGYPSMPIALAQGVASLVGEAWPFAATFVGGVGAAIAGSNTVSNMMFSLFQWSVAKQIGADPTWVAALQAVGGAAGNTICVHNVVAAAAVVGLVGKEGAVLRKTMPVFTYYALLAGALGYAAVWGAQTGPLNAGTLVAAAIALLAVATVAWGTRRPVSRAPVEVSGGDSQLAEEATEI